MPDAIENAAREIVDATMQSPYSSGSPEDIHWRTAKSERIASILRRHLAPVVKDRPDKPGWWVCYDNDGEHIFCCMTRDGDDLAPLVCGYPEVGDLLKDGFTRWVKIAVPDLGAVEEKK